MWPHYKTSITGNIYSRLFWNQYSRQSCILDLHNHLTCKMLMPCRHPYITDPATRMHLTISHHLHAYRNYIHDRISVKLTSIKSLVLYDMPMMDIRHEIRYSQILSQLQLIYETNNGHITPPQEETSWWRQSDQSCQILPKSAHITIRSFSCTKVIIIVMMIVWFVCYYRGCGWNSLSLPLS